MTQYPSNLDKKNTLSDLEQDDKQLIAMLKDITYFNLEISPSSSSLVFNASKKGIEAFLKKYGNLKEPPEVISFTGMQRPNRRWFSPEIRFNEQIETIDPTPYRVGFIDYLNQLIPDLHIEYVKENTSLVFYAMMREGIPWLVINQQGWNTFLILLKNLHDKSYWFFVTASNPSYQGPPFFHLTKPYVEDTPDPIFKALEFIRLEPREDIYLSFPMDGIHANSSGLLLFSHWMHDFANTNKDSQVFCNRWNTLPKTLVNEAPYFQPHTIHLQKVKEEVAYPLFSLERKEGDKEDESSDLYIFGNSSGFKELAELTEEYAFSPDHDTFYSKPPKRRLRGDMAETALGPEGFSQQGFMLVGGGVFTPQYNPYRFIGNPNNPSCYNSWDEILGHFLNERILFQ